MAMKMFASILFASTLFMSGCAAPGLTKPAEIKVLRDDFKKQTTFVGPDCATRFATRLFVRAWHRDASPDLLEYQVYAVDSYTSDWRFYDEAYDADGNRLAFVSIDRTVDCMKGVCTHEEHMGIKVARDYLDKHASSGLSFKVSGRGGEQVFFLPSQCIQAFLEKTQSPS